ncbi:MAG: hypothetical protein ACPGOY_15315 [Rhodospirillaceae bacterium]
MSLNIKSLSATEKKRIDRLKNKRGRNNPAKVPARLTRTSAFAPRRRGLITDTNFSRIYVVPGHSVVKVTGRELGTQHRDALYGLFRQKYSSITINDDESPIGKTVLHIVKTTWRDILKAMRLTEHANNVASVALAFEEIMSVLMVVYEGNEEAILQSLLNGKMPNAKYQSRHIIHEFTAMDLGLDNEVQIIYGPWISDSMSRLRLVSLNADVHFRLTSDYAKCFWPFIDGLPNNIWVDEDVLGSLVGRDIWAAEESSTTRREFRRNCRNAFDNMVKAGGLKSWTIEVLGSGRRKKHRYHYTPMLAMQMELELNAS